MGLVGDKTLGYMYHPSSWGKGYATEALSAFVKAFFEKRPQEECILAETDVNNAGSRNVLQKVGFVEIRRETFDNPTMGPQAAVVYELKRGNLRAAKSV
jgi:RimJ/RimL family protein N-acetyltransferase